MAPARQSGPRLAVRINPLAAAVATAVGSMSIISVTADAASQDVFREELIVTATRRSASVQDIPINISAVSGEQIESLQITSLAELARWVPGLTLVDQGQREGSPLIIRGLNVSGLSSSETTVGNGSGDTVATYYGEIPVYVDLELIDIDRVEVLRGPQGTLFGANSLGGAVRYIPKPPNTQEFEADVYVSGYKFSESDDLSYNANFILNAPIGDTLAFRGFLGYHDRKGFIDYNFLVRDPGTSNPQPDFTNPADVAANLTRKEDANDVTTTSLRLALLWEMTANVDATLSYYLQDRDIGGRQVNSQESMAAAPLGLATSEYIAALRVLEPSDRKNQIFNLDVIADIGFAELTWASGYTEYEQEGSRDQTDLLLGFGYPYSDFPTFTAFTRETETQEILTSELRLVSQGDGPLNWIGGLFYYDSDQEVSSTEFTPGLASCAACDPPGFFPPSINLTDDVEFFQIQTQDTREWAIFGEVGYFFTDAWQITVGGRYFDIEEDISDRTATPLFDIWFFGAPEGLPPSAYFVTSDPEPRSIDDFIGKFNTSYEFDDNQLGYFTISEGYRRGGANLAPPCTAPPQQACATKIEQTFDSDTTVNYELGYKGTFVENRVTFNAALFYIDWKDVQVGDLTAQGALPITVNGNDAASRGIELDLTAFISDNWSIFAGYSYTNAELDEDAPRLGGSDGDRLPGSPEHQGSFVVRYDNQIAGDLDLGIQYGLTAQSDVYTKLGIGSGCCRDSGEALSGFALSNASISLGRDRWEARLYSENLFDKYAETGVRLDRSFTGSAGATQDFQLRRYWKYMAAPRTIGLDIRYKFGSTD